MPVANEFVATEVGAGMEIDGAPVAALAANAVAGAALGSMTGAAAAEVPAAVTAEEIAAEVPDIVETTDTRLSECERLRL